MWKATLAVAALTLAGTHAPAQILWAPKGKPASYRPPHKAHTRIADLKAKHSGKTEWREPIVDDEHLRSEYIQAKPGYRTRRGFHPDTRSWWVIREGEVQFDIETVGSFVARKGSMVQVPMQTFFHWEVVGSTPALLFETNIAGAKMLYEGSEEPPKVADHDWYRVTFSNRRPGVFEKDNKPHITFEEVAEGLDSGKRTGTQRIVEDARGAANFIYGYNSKLPPVDPKARGHYHPEGAEYWLILRGRIRYPIEGVGVVIAEEGDVVYVPRNTFHFPRWWGEGASCRLAMNGFPYISHLFEPD